MTCVMVLPSPGFDPRVGKHEASTALRASHVLACGSLSPPPPRGFLADEIDVGEIEDGQRPDVLDVVPLTQAFTDPSDFVVERVELVRANEIRVPQLRDRESREVGVRLRALGKMR